MADQQGVFSLDEKPETLGLVPGVSESDPQKMVGHYQQERFTGPLFFLFRGSTGILALFCRVPLLGWSQRGTQRIETDPNVLRSRKGEETLLVALSFIQQVYHDLGGKPKKGIGLSPLPPSPLPSPPLPPCPQSSIRSSPLGKTILPAVIASLQASENNADS